MTDYIHHTSNTIDRAAGPLPRAWRYVSGINLLPDAALKPLGWLPVSYNDPAFNPATQVKEGPTGVSVGDSVTPGASSVSGVYTVRAKTQAEIDAEDEDVLRQRGKDAALVLVELIEWTLANTSMQGSDFSTDVRDAYLALKAVADRLRA